MRRRAASVLLALLVTVESGCTTLTPDVAALSQRPGEVSPLLWRATSPNGGTFYMLGSVHIGRGDARKMGPIVDAAWDRAEELVVEVDVSRVSEAELSALMERWGQLGSGCEIWPLLDDEKALEQRVFRPLEDSPEFEVFYERVFFRRNEQMAIGLENLGRDGRSRFVVIGAGHLLGDRSVPAQLAKRGYRIERIRSLSQLTDSR